MNNLFFSGSEPQLLNEKALKNLNKIFENNISETNTTGEHIITLYNEYLKPNLFALLVLIIVCAFLFIRYVIKKYNYNDENKDEIDEQIEKEINKNESKNDNMSDMTDIDKFTISSKNNDISDDNSDNRSRFTELNEEYNRAVKENIDNMSEQAIKDIYKKKKDKLSFNELTRIIVDGT